MIPDSAPHNGLHSIYTHAAHMKTKGKRHWSRKHLDTRRTVKAICIEHLAATVATSETAENIPTQASVRLFLLHLTDSL
jgi:hypothetical protein